VLEAPSLHVIDVALYLYNTNKAIWAMVQSLQIPVLILCHYRIVLQLLSLLYNFFYKFQKGVECKYKEREKTAYFDYYRLSVTLMHAVCTHNIFVPWQHKLHNATLPLPYALNENSYRHSNWFHISL
jgi:hypothetical protein